MKHLFMKRLLTMALALFATVPLWATWPMHFDDAGFDYLNEMIPVGEAGDHYVCGAIKPAASDGTMQLGGITVRGNGDRDILFGRLDAHGNWLWAKTLGNADYNDAPIKIMTDRAENIYLVGPLRGTLRIGGFTLSGDQTENAFVAKFNHLGDVLWAKRIGDPSQKISVKDADLYETLPSAENQRITLYIAAQQNKGMIDSKAQLFRFDGATGRHEHTITANTPYNPDRQSKVRVGRTWINWVIEFAFDFELSASNDRISVSREPGTTTDHLYLVRIEEATLPSATQITKGYHLPYHRIHAMDCNDQGDRTLVLSLMRFNRQNSAQAHRITTNGLGAFAEGEMVYDFGYRTFRGVALEPGGSFRYAATESYWHNGQVTLGRFDSQQRTIREFRNNLIGYTFHLKAMRVNAHGRYTLVGTTDINRTDSEDDYDLYAVTATPEGVLEPGTVDIGAAVPIPPSAVNPATGDLYRLPIGYFDHLGNAISAAFQTAVVDGKTQVLAFAPGVYTIEWAGRHYGQEIPGSNPPRFVDSGLKQTISVRFPNNPRIHIAGTPIDLNPVAQGDAEPEYQYHSVVYRHPTTPEPEDGIFTPTATGENNPNDAYSVILYSRDNEVAKAVVLKTVHWWEAPTLTLATTEIGQAIPASARHTDASGRTGFVLNPASPFDGAGERPAHDRTARQGPIIAVNDGSRNRGEPVQVNGQPVFYPDAGDPQGRPIHDNDFVVVYYAQDETLGVAWPQHPVLVQPTWPKGLQQHQTVAQSGGLPTTYDLPGNGDIGPFHLADNGTLTWFATDTHALLSQAGPEAEPGTLAQATGNAGDLDGSPDGTTIAWTDPDGQAVYLTHLDGSGQQRIDQPGVFEEPTTITHYGEWYYVADPRKRTIVRLHRDGNGRIDSSFLAVVVNLLIAGAQFDVANADNHDNPHRLDQQQARYMIGLHGPTFAAILATFSRKPTNTFTSAWDKTSLLTRFADWGDGNLENAEITSITFANDNQGNGSLTFHLDTPTGPQTEQALLDGTVVVVDQTDVRPDTLAVGADNIYWVDEETNRIVSCQRNDNSVFYAQEHNGLPVVSLAVDDSGQRLYWLERTSEGTGRLVTAPRGGAPEILAENLNDPAYLQRVGDELTWRTTTHRQIVIASEQGSEFGNQPQLDPDLFPDYHIYHQADRTLPGFNPNNEHAAMFDSNRGSGYQAVFALRSDLTDVSEPYVLLKYRDPATQDWAFLVYKVRTRAAGFDFTYIDEAGHRLFPPYPLRLQELAPSQSTLPVAPWDAPYWRDHTDQEWSIAAGDLARGYYYQLRDSFYWDPNQPDQYSGLIDGSAPWLDGITDDLGNPPSRGTPLTCHYHFTWPENPPILQQGETLIDPKRELPDIFNQAATHVVHERRDGQSVAEPFSLVRLFRPLEPIAIPLGEEETLPDDVKTQTTGQYTRILGNQSGTITIPFSLRQRLNFANQALHFSGILEAEGAGEPLLLVNVMTRKEADLLKSISQDGAFKQLIETLYEQTRNPNNVDSDSVPPPLQQDPGYFVGMSDAPGYLEPASLLGQGAVLTAGKATGTGYVTLMFNNHTSLAGLPVDVKIIRVGCLPIDENRSTPYVGQVKVIESSNPFDEQITLRHSGDFGGAPDHLAFQWLRSSAAPDGSAPEPPTFDADGTIVDWKSWHEYSPPSGDPNPQDCPNPDNPRCGRVEITLQDNGADVLADSFFLVRYQNLPSCDNQDRYSQVAGAPGGSVLHPEPALAQGWIKRVLNRLDPYEARFEDFRNSEVNTTASIIRLLGERYEGNIAFNDDPTYLESLGMIELYETILNRAMDLSINRGVENADVNSALLLVSSRLAQFYQILGQEAFADASDPTIGFDTGSVLGSEASALWTFRNQVASPLAEELTLLRGRSDSVTRVQTNPVYNRLHWNLTGQEGEVAYAVSYNLQDVNLDGRLDEFDAKLSFPQGHGDAWGHYLTAAKSHYRLLRHANYEWLPRTEIVTLYEGNVGVDYMDERRFAQSAAAKALTGREILDLTYRERFTADPLDQWQGYLDTETAKIPTANPGPEGEPEQTRAWGLDGWARRTGQAALFDWATANSLLRHEHEGQGIQKIDRTTVPELDQIASRLTENQIVVDAADSGRNPLGLSKGVVPFDLNPRVLDFREGEPHFEQIYKRAKVALTNTRAVFDRANQHTHMLRYKSETDQDFRLQINDQERDYRNRLIEIFGYPYSGHMGPGQPYETGYDGPDLIHYRMVDPPAALGETLPPLTTVRRTLSIPSELDFRQPSVVTDQGGLERLNTYTQLEVDYFVPRNGLGLVTAPPELGSRRAIGEVQRKINQLLLQQADLRRFLAKYDNHNRKINDAVALLAAHYNTRQEEIRLRYDRRNATIGFNISLRAAEVAKKGFLAAAQAGQRLLKVLLEGPPKVNGFSNDLTSGIRATYAKILGIVIASSYRSAGIADLTAFGLTQGKEVYMLDHDIRVLINNTNYEAQQKARELEQLIREELELRIEGFTLMDQISQASMEVRATLAAGERLIEERLIFRRNAAAATQKHRYKDMAFRLFRNDALQKYHAQFDLAARYVYLAAAAYDYDTNLLGSHQDAGRQFLSDIVRQRGVGEISNGTPVIGSGGLAGLLAKLNANFQVYKTQMGFNNPQSEEYSFSLRRELFRLHDDEAGENEWRAVLRQHRVADLWQIPEYARYCRPEFSRADGPQPGLVIPFAAVVNGGENLFGWPLAAGDSAYDASRFATRIRGSGIFLTGYNDLPLSATPRAYLVPVGMDILSSPFSGDFTKRAWRVVDQVLPEPYALGAGDLDDPDWMPTLDTLSEDRFSMRRFPLQRAFDDLTGDYGDQFPSIDTRLVGRAVANDRWLLIIPGSTLLNDGEAGLDHLIGAAPGSGISDIKIFLSTYSYQGLGRKTPSEQETKEAQP